MPQRGRDKYVYATPEELAAEAQVAGLFLYSTEKKVKCNKIILQWEHLFGKDAGMLKVQKKKPSKDKTGISISKELFGRLQEKANSEFMSVSGLVSKVMTEWLSCDSTDRASRREFHRRIAAVLDGQDTASHRTSGRERIRNQQLDEEESSLATG